MAKVAKTSSLSNVVEPVTRGKHHRDIAKISGEVGSGKTFYALTAPGPTVVFNIDRGLEGVVENEEFAEKDIYQHVIDWSPGETEDDDDLMSTAIKLRDEFRSKLREVLAAGARSIIVDTESRLWEIYRYAEWGTATGNLRDFAKLNQRYEDFINVVKSSEANLFLIQSMKDNWNMKGEAWRVEGRKVWGYEHLASAVMTEMHFRLDDDVPVDESNEDPNYRYVVDIGKCRHNLKLQHTTQPRMSFPQMGRLMIPGSKKADWL